MIYQLRPVLTELYRHVGDVTGKYAPSNVDVLDDAILVPHLAEAINAFVGLKRRIKQLESGAARQKHTGNLYTELFDSSSADASALRQQVHDANTQLEYMRRECEEHRNAVAELQQQLCAAKQQAGTHDPPPGTAPPSRACLALSSHHADCKQLVAQLQHLERCNAQLQQEQLESTQQLAAMRTKAADVASRLHKMQERHYAVQWDDTLASSVRDLADMAGPELADVSILMAEDSEAGSSCSPQAGGAEEKVLLVANDVLQQQVGLWAGGAAAVWCARDQ
jgi:hypothetical protein